MSKRPGGTLGSLMSKKSKDEQKYGNSGGGGGGGNSLARSNPFLSKPVQPEKVIHGFLTQCRNAARNYLPKDTKYPITKPFCEVEARIGILKINQRRVASSGPKRINNTVVPAFDCSSVPQRPSMESGISRSHYVHWTQAGLSEPSPLSAALGVIMPGKSTKEIVATMKKDLVETEYIETVFAGYPQERRVAVDGLLPFSLQPALPQGTRGKMEYKEKLMQHDLTLPAANYDFRISLASEKVVDHNLTLIPDGWSLHRVKRRRSFQRRDKNMSWQIDVTEVTTTYKHKPNKPQVVFEVEMELQANPMLQLVNEQDANKASEMCKGFSKQLWWIVSQLNPLSDTVDVEEYLQDHPDAQATQLALATTVQLRQYLERGGPSSNMTWPIATPNETPMQTKKKMLFTGCMPVNFSRHNIEEIQQSSGYYLSEKTDGVRHFLIFTGSTAVLVDRAMRGKQPIPIGKMSDPFAPLLPLINPGTVLDGEVVLHRGNNVFKARPIFIVFDVLCLSATKPILHLNFDQRLKHLLQGTFAKGPNQAKQMFDPKLVANAAVPLPLVRKNFVPRTELAELLSHVVEEKGLRSYRNGDLHNHLTDGIIFQPNLPYVCGTDVHLLKWKYLDTVTIDVEILPPRQFGNNQHDDDDNEGLEELRVGVLGEDQTIVDMTRYVRLPKSERFRLEADRLEKPKARIAEVGFDPETGEWYYLTMRPDKIAPNHISTVLGTLLELAESLTTEELQYRMSIPTGQRDTYRKDVRGMLKQLLDHQQRKKGR